MTDILIIGAGPAGLTAAIYAARAGRAVTVCEKETVGGQITHAHRVDNYPGLVGISGLELGDRLCAHAMDAGAQIEFTAVTGLTREENGLFRAVTEDGEIEAKAVIFAAGARPRPLGLDREEKFVGSGVSYCALCDGSFFAGQDVAVVGGGNSAFSDALFLARICRSVTIIHRRPEFRAEEALIRSAKETPNIRFLTSAAVTELIGGSSLEAVRVGGQVLRVSGLFAALGREPDCGLIAHLAQLDENGYAVTAGDCAANTPGLYVAGDCRQKQVRQLTTAAADGTIAATNACAWLKGR